MRNLSFRDRDTGEPLRAQSLEALLVPLIARSPPPAGSISGNDEAHRPFRPGKAGGWPQIFHSCNFCDFGNVCDFRGFDPRLRMKLRRGKRIHTDSGNQKGMRMKRKMEKGPELATEQTGMRRELRELPRMTLSGAWRPSRSWRKSRTVRAIFVSLFFTADIQAWFAPGCWFLLRCFSPKLPNSLPKTSRYRNNNAFKA